MKIKNEDYILRKLDLLQLSLLQDILVYLPGVKKYRIPKIERPNAHRTLC